MSESSIKLIFTVFLLSTLINDIVAQEGFPVDGSWRGGWGLAGGKQTPVVLVMKWDGEKIGGLINPGPESIEFKSAILTPETWMVHIEATDRDGIPIIIDGRLHDIGSYNRSIAGTWNQDGLENTFAITRE